MSCSPSASNKPNLSRVSRSGALSSASCLGVRGCSAALIKWNQAGAQEPAVCAEGRRRSIAGDPSGLIGY